MRFLASVLLYFYERIRVRVRKSRIASAHLPAHLLLSHIRVYTFINATSLTTGVRAAFGSPRLYDSNAKTIDEHDENRTDKYAVEDAGEREILYCIVTESVREKERRESISASARRVP